MRRWSRPPPWSRARPRRGNNPWTSARRWCRSRSRRGACLALARAARVVDGLDFRRCEGAVEEFNFVDQAIEQFPKNNIASDLEVSANGRINCARLRRITHLDTIKIKPRGGSIKGACDVRPSV